MPRVTPMLATWLHDLDPFAWRISGGFGIRWYGISYVLGFLIAWLWLRSLAKRGLVLLKPEVIPDVILAQVIGVMVGGRLGYILFYQPSLLTGFRSSFPFWDALDITTGGMASHGGMIGILFASLWCARHYKVPALHVIDCIASVGLPGVVLGRVANFVNGELLGKVVGAPGEPGPWWAVRYPQELLDRPIPSGSPLVGGGMGQLDRIRIALGLRPDEPVIGHVEALIDQLRAGSEEARRILEPVLTARHPSQLYQALGEGIVTLAVVWFVWRKPRRAGVITGTFLVTYAIGRIATEFIRLPDAHLAVQRFGPFSRGQWLSVLMLVGGATLLAVVRGRDTVRIGGWATRDRAETPSESPRA